MRYVLLSTLLALTACNTTPQKPSAPPQVITVPQVVTVYKPCPVAMPERKHAACVPADDGRIEWLRCRLVRDVATETYIRDLETGLSLCSSKE